MPLYRTSSVVLRISLRWASRSRSAGKFLEELASFDIGGDKEFSQEGLSLSDSTSLFSSTLYLCYRRRRLLARLEQARAATGADRDKLLVELCSAKDLPQAMDAVEL